MAGVEPAGAYNFECLLEREVFTFDKVEEALQSHKGSVSLVAMVNIFFDTQFVECNDTTHTEQNFLLDTVFPITSVELVGDLTVPFGVHLVVGVEKVEVDTPYSHFPEVCLDNTFRIRHFDNHRCAISVLDLRERQIGEILRLVVGNLLSFRR